MISKVKIAAIHHRSFGGAFKRPILCDVSKVHTGCGMMTKVTHCNDDKNWRQKWSRKKVFATKSLTQKGGFASVDKVIERIENKYWVFEVCEFQSWMLGFYIFVGQWKTTTLEPNKIEVEYAYELHSSMLVQYLINWLFPKLFWNIYIKRVLENIREMVDNNEPYLYE